jgi:hypothetical protein
LGHHANYDRLVFDFSEPNTGLRFVAGYQDGVLRVDLGHGARCRWQADLHRSPDRIAVDVAH